MISLEWFRGFAGGAAALMLFASVCVAEEITFEAAVAEASASEVILLGEVHDNPEHHKTQAALIEVLQPRAVVWEMLTESQAARVTPAALQDPAGLGDLLEWQESGWPDYALYQPVFAAAPKARHFGEQVTRSAARASMQQGIVAAFGADAGSFGLDQALPDDEQAARETMQQEAHCGALPASLLPQMVDIQRLRDAALARAVVQALDETGGPVAVIAGNGHVRSDYGIAVYLAHATPDVRVFALGQSEEGAISGVFDAVLDGPTVQRPDPCLAFQ